MKRNIFAICFALFACVACMAPMTAYGDSGGVFLDAQIGQSNLDSGIYADNDIGFSGDVGYRFTINESLSVGPELGYTWLGKFDTRSSLLRNLHTAHVSGGNVGANARYNLTDTFYVLGRIGVYHSGPTATYVAADGSFANVDKNSTKEYAGIGGGADLFGNISLGVDYSYYRVNAGSNTLNPRLLAGFVEFRF